MLSCIRPLRTGGRIYAQQKEPRASKYCFSARCPLRANHLSTETVALVFGFDPKPSVGRDVSQVAEIFGKEAGYVTGETEVLFHEECPTEIVNEIYVSVFAEPIEEHVSMNDIHALAIKQQMQVTKPSILRGYDADDEGDDDDNTSSGGPSDGRPPKGGGGGGGGTVRRRQPKSPNDGSGIALV